MAGVGQTEPIGGPAAEGPFRVGILPPPSKRTSDGYAPKEVIREIEITGWTHGGHQYLAP
jgi:hypothetical protein